MKSRFENTKKDNKGFSLVELIVAVVILGIIAVVAIGGLYSNVTKARINTDISNARDIQSALSTLAVDKDVYTWAKSKELGDTLYIYWNAAVAKDAIASYQSGQTVLANGKKLGDKIAAILTDGLPAPKAGGGFLLKVKAEAGKTGNVTAECEAQDSKGFPLVEAE